MYVYILNTKSLNIFINLNELINGLLPTKYLLSSNFPQFLPRSNPSAFLQSPLRLLHPLYSFPTFHLRYLLFCCLISFYFLFSFNLLTLYIYIYIYKVYDVIIY